MKPMDYTKIERNIDEYAYVNNEALFFVRFSNREIFLSWSFCDSRTFV